MPVADFTGIDENVKHLERGVEAADSAGTPSAGTGNFDRIDQPY